MDSVKKLKKGVWIVAVSGGVDSMTLFDLCIKNKLSLIAAHVNYHKRATSDQDEQCVREYALAHGIPFFAEQGNDYQSGNFQAWAREKRYAFFSKLCKQYHAQGVLVAHHSDDVLETYLMSKQRNSVPETWGMKAKTNLYGIDVYRPLLAMDKADCYQYCKEHKVPFCEDESNFTNTYARNKIRHEIIEKMSKPEKTALIEKIMLENKQIEHSIEAYHLLLNADQSINLERYFKYDCALRLFCLRYWLKKEGKISRNISKKQCIQWDQLFMKDGNKSIDLDREYQMEASYQTITIKRREDVSYCYKMETIESMETPWFKVASSGPSTCALTCSKDDFPLTIRNWHPQDAIKLRLGTKKINRWFIDRKIPLKDRKKWPIVLNRHLDIILVPQIGCNIEHFSNNPTMFVIK